MADWKIMMYLGSDENLKSGPRRQTLLLFSTSVSQDLFLRDLFFYIHDLFILTLHVIRFFKNINNLVRVKWGETLILFWVKCGPNMRQSSTLIQNTKSYLI